MDGQILNQVTYKATLKLIDVIEIDSLKLDNKELKLRADELKKIRIFYKVLYYDRYK